MAKFSIISYNGKMDNGKYRVYVRFSHNSKSIYRKSGIDCTEKDFNKKGVITNNSIISAVYESNIREYENKLRKISQKVDIKKLSAKSLFEAIEKNDIEDVFDIDFLEYMSEYISKLEKEERVSTKELYNTVYLALKDFAMEDKLPIRKITVDFIERFVEYLQTTRKKTWSGVNGTKVTRMCKPLCNRSINNYMMVFKSVYSKLKKKYSDPHTGVERINACPFIFYEPKMVFSKDGYRALDIDTIRSFTAVDSGKLTKRQKLGRDMFLLSFLLLGTNATDLYDLEISDYKNGRISYKRNKTKNRREDMAFISIEVLPFAKDILKRNKGCMRLINAADNYKNLIDFEWAVNSGIKSLCKHLGMREFTFYAARHSWASIARNKCGISREDIDECLNHTNVQLKMADKYISKDFSNNDLNNRKVIDLVFNGIGCI